MGILENKRQELVKRFATSGKDAITVGAEISAINKRLKAVNKAEWAIRELNEYVLLKRYLRENGHENILEGYYKIQQQSSPIQSETEVSEG